MPQSLARVLVHILFSTKNREPLLTTPELRGAMNAYMVGVLGKQGCPSLIVNCVADHMHVLCALSRTLSIADLLEEMKKSTSRWAKTHDPSLHAFRWQAGYGSFSVSESNAPQVKRYIERQEEHHRKVSFQDEYRQFLKLHNIDYDERYVWD